MKSTKPLVGLHLYNNPQPAGKRVNVRKAKTMIGYYSIRPI